MDLQRTDDRATSFGKALGNHLTAAAHHANSLRMSGFAEGKCNSFSFGPFRVLIRNYQYQYSPREKASYLYQKAVQTSTAKSCSYTVDASATIFEAHRTSPNPREEK